MRVETWDDLIRRYPCLSAYENNGYSEDGPGSIAYFCYGVFEPPEDMEFQTALAVGDKCDLSKAWNIRNYDAVLAKGTVIKGFVKEWETVGSALKRLPNPPVLIICCHKQGRAFGPCLAEDGYAEMVEHWVYQLVAF